MAILSVDENTPASAIPHTGTWRPGALNSTRYFDVSIAGKCSDEQAKINFQAAEKIPSFFTKNAEGKIVFAAPQVVGVITPAKEHGSWITIQLQSVNGQNITATSLTNVAKHVCLGIRKQGESEYFDVIHAGKLTSEYVDVTRDAAVELVPFLSKTATGASGYTAVTPGDEVKFTDVTLPTTGSFDFGSVYRISLEDHGQWLTNQPCDLRKVIDYRPDCWFNWGKLGIGTVINSEGNRLDNQLVAVHHNASIAYSSDGRHWIKLETTGLTLDGWYIGPIYGNGIWCTGSWNQAIISRSINGGKNWTSVFSSTNEGGRDNNLHFANGMFLTIPASGAVYSSPDGEVWTKIGTIPATEYRALTYGGGKWLCGSTAGDFYSSADGKGAWTSLGRSNFVYLGCYVNGYFYGINRNTVWRSQDGAKWETITTLPIAGNSITYWKNKLYVLSSCTDDGYFYHLGLP